MIFVIVTLVVAVLFWAIVELAAVVGFLGVLTGERIERCPHCHRDGLTTDGELHELGCPIDLRERWVRFAHASLHDWHGGHSVHFKHH